MGHHRAVTLAAADSALAAILISPSYAQGRASSRDLSVKATTHSIPWTASVIECSGTDVYITAGADRGIEPGMVLHVYH